MKKLTAALTGTALLTLILGLAGCGDTAKVTDKREVSTPEGTTTVKDTKEVKQSGNNPPPGRTIARSVSETIPLLIPTDIRDAMVAHCRREDPLESCGILGGKSQRVQTFYPLRNIAASKTRYQADQHELVQAWRSLREQQQQILAIYHSHPRWPALPSKTDLELNYWCDTPRIIVSLLTEPAEIRVWRLGNDSFQELPWTLVEPLGAPADSLQVAPEAD